MAFFLCTPTEGGVYYSDIVNYSPEFYANNQIDKNEKPNLIALVKTMVIYGDYAAKNFT